MCPCPYLHAVYFCHPPSPPPPPYKFPYPFLSYAPPRKEGTQGMTLLSLAKRAIPQKKEMHVCGFLFLKKIKGEITYTRHFCNWAILQEEELAVLFSTLGEFFVGCENVKCLCGLFFSPHMYVLCPCFISFSSSVLWEMQGRRLEKKTLFIVVEIFFLWNWSLWHNNKKVWKNVFWASDVFPWYFF